MLRCLHFTFHGYKAVPRTAKKCRWTKVTTGGGGKAVNGRQLAVTGQYKEFLTLSLLYPLDPSLHLAIISL